MARKIAVLVRDRQGEALRMALGLTLMDDAVDVFLVDRRFDLTGTDAANVALMKEIEIAFFSNHEGNRGSEYISTEDMARRLTGYDHVFPY